MSGLAQPPRRIISMVRGSGAVVSSVSAIGAPVLFSGGRTGRTSYHSPARGLGVMPPFTRDRLARLPRRRLHEGRNVSKAIVDLVEIEGRQVVLKDFASRPWPVRQLWGPWQLGREARAYSFLAGLRGTPAFLGRVDRQAIVLEYVPGRTLAALRPG